MRKDWKVGVPVEPREEKKRRVGVRAAATREARPPIEEIPGGTVAGAHVRGERPRPADQAREVQAPQGRAG